MASSAPGGGIDGIISQLDQFFGAGCPLQLPDGVREFLVKFGPWITLVVLIISIPAMLAALGVGTLLSPFLGPKVAGFGLPWLLGAVQTAITAVALPGLFRRQYASWRLMFMGQGVGILANLLSGAILGTLLGAAIGLFLLFQLRPKYVH